MERLTNRIGEYVYYANWDYSKNIPAEYSPNDVGRILKALCAYESTNHTPEECAAAFEELAAYRAAEQDGTLLRLPCKVGDTVWILCNVFGGNEQKRVIESRTITEIKHNKFNKNTMISKEPFELHFFPSEIGKTVFLALEAAEAALKEQEEQT